MHEVSIAQSLVDLVEGRARDAGMDRVLEVHIRVGSLSCINSESLRTAFEIVTRGSALSSSQLRIREIEAKGRCFDCERDYDFPIDYACFCPYCFGSHTQILEGREMVLDRIEGENFHAN